MVRRFLKKSAAFVLVFAFLSHGPAPARAEDKTKEAAPRKRTTAEWKARRHELRVERLARLKKKREDIVAKGSDPAKLADIDARIERLEKRIAKAAAREGAEGAEETL